MTGAARRWTLTVVAGILLASVTAYFGLAVAAAVARLSGQRAYYRGDFALSWKRYGEASRFGADPAILEIDRAQMLLFALDQSGLGVPSNLKMSPDDAAGILRALLARRIAETPHRAFLWSLASDLYLYEAREKRRRTPLDLSTLSEDPMKNLLPEEGLAIAALREASRREPNNYLYQDQIAENFIEWGLVERSEEHVRRAVALYPYWNAHVYLEHPPAEDGLLTSAVAGYEDALKARSLLGRSDIECDAGWFLSRQPRYAEAAEFFKRAIRDAPGMADAHFGLGVASYWLGRHADAEQELEGAGVDMSQSPFVFYYLGLARLKLGKQTEAIEALRTARELDPHTVQFFQSLADALESAGQIRDADLQYRAAAYLNPESGEAWSTLLAFYGRHADLRGEARRICEHLGSTKTDPAIYKTACDDLQPGAP